MSWERSYWLLIVVLAVGCSSRQAPAAQDGSGPVDETIASEVSPCVDPIGDADDDGISNGEEGCLQGRDTDSDELPDWQDFDADGDGIQDRIEKGVKGSCLGPAPDRWPCDSDGDGLSDYLDTDSDGDGLLDRQEDVNGDGLVGCCLVRCHEPRAPQAWASCIFNDQGCGVGQTCTAGLCMPPTALLCSDGETDPRRADSFGDGKPDGERGTFICRDKSAQDPVGRKQLQKRRSSNPSTDIASGDWIVALPVDATYHALSIVNPQQKLAAATIDHAAGPQLVAGFIISLPDTTANIEKAQEALLAQVSAQPPGGPGSVQELAAGTRGKSHDTFDTIWGTTLEVSLLQGSDATTVRNQLLATLLGRPLADLGNLPPPFAGASGTSLVVRLVILRRFAFAKNSWGKVLLDASGFPQEDLLRPELRRIIVMGAVALRAHYEDPTRETGILVDDLSGGSAVADYCGTVQDTCDVGKGPAAAVLDFAPIAASLALTLEGAEVPRSRQSGFDFHPEQNSVGFFPPKPAGDLVISYKRWGPPPTDCGGW